MLEEPFMLDDTEVFARASIGISVAEPGDVLADGAEELLRNADVAMYMAKENGKNRYQLFEPAMHDTALKRLELKAVAAARARARRVPALLPAGDRARVGPHLRRSRR